jgi:hypothetical protein
VWNKTSGVNRLGLQYLGLSTKRDDDSKIGQFGSGIKYAPILSLRKGIEFVFVGFDEDGQYQLKYTTKSVRGIEVVYYDYGNEQIPSSFTVDAGKLSWEDEFQIYREVVSNAKDGADNDPKLWGIESVDKISFNPGEFSIFIQATDAIMEVYKMHDYYYCDKTEVYYTCKYSDISVMKNQNNNTAVYCKSVLSYDNDTPSFFYYNGKHFKLNEERRLAAYYTVTYDIAKVICSMDNEFAINQVLTKIIGENPIDYSSDEFWSFSEGCFEFNKVNEAWKRKFVDKYGEKAVLINQIESAYPTVSLKIKELGYIPITCLSNNLYTILNRSGVNTVDKIAGQELQYDLDYNYEEYPNFLRALKIAEHFEPGLKMMNKRVALFQAESQTLLGLTINTDKPRSERQILVSKTHAESSSIESIIGTIIHEYDHYETGIGDNNIEFRNLADSRIGGLMVKNYREPLLSTTKGSKDISIKIANLPYVQGLDFHIEKSAILDGHIIRVGKKKFVAKSVAMANNLVGKLMPSDDNVSMLITNAFPSPVESDNVEIEEI